MFAKDTLVSIVCDCQRTGSMSVSLDPSCKKAFHWGCCGISMAKISLTADLASLSRYRNNGRAECGNPNGLVLYPSYLILFN